MLMIVLNNIGGSNIILYYIVDHKYYYADDTALYQAKNEGRDRVVVASTFD
jgi:GGDEF domain-containing protein